MPQYNADAAHHVTHGALTVQAVQAFKDNLIWIISKNDCCTVVDPGQAAPVLAHLQMTHQNLSDIVITHHHHDHIGGVEELLLAYPKANLWRASEAYALPQFVTVCQGAITLKQWAIPGHTLDHVAYFIESDKDSPARLFCGDTLFSGGCGRVFEGTFAQMLDSLNTLAQLPDDTLVYCAHEYTASNLRFACFVDPNNQQLQDYQKWVHHQVAHNLSTLPSNIALEKTINPFLRATQLQTWAQEHSGQKMTDTLVSFTYLRTLKNTF